MIRQTLFTFVSEVAGSTVVEQAIGNDVVDAVRRWAGVSSIRPKLNEDIVGIDATPVSGMAHVWCVTGLTAADDFFMTHVVQTSVVDG